ncbi:hypothetical protein BJX61DRAFT_507415 [Aspergillus egyptiacus]|nr:hypothetical protein BJX61DRAFT_507415 [Aspergillus egyptiacus]
MINPRLHHQPISQPLQSNFEFSKMRFLDPFSLLSLSLFAQTALSSKLTLTIPPSTHLPNPHALPADTSAILTSGSLVSPLKAPLTSSGTFVFSGLTIHDYKLPQTDDVSGSYLLDIRSSEYVFAPLRVDVDEKGDVVGVWETFRGNEWGNRGVEKYKAVNKDEKTTEEVTVDLRVVGRKGFYEIRQTFSPLSLFKNPMILLALVALGFTFGMPKLMENSTFSASRCFSLSLLLFSTSSHLMIIRY